MADGKERPIHENHRARMQERVAHNGMESLAEHEVLEYMLYLAIPRQDTNPLAHRLIDHFGSFCRVMEATPQELMQVKGVGQRSAQLIRLIKLLNDFVTCLAQLRHSGLVHSIGNENSHDTISLFLM